MRYAISFAPPADSPLWQQGSRWLGRDAFSGHSLSRSRFRDVDPERMIELTRAPAHYGFQVTIIPPFRLAERTSEENLLGAMVHFAARQSPLWLSAFEIAENNGFFCLRPTHPSPAVQTLAGYCVRAFDRCRAPLTPSELARRKAAVLSSQEKINLAIWGHPYVFEQFRFHFTLTARMAEGREKETVHAALLATFSSLLANPLAFDALCLFVEPAIGQPMRCLYRFPFLLSSPEPEECSKHDQQLLPQNLYSGHQYHPARLGLHQQFPGA